MANYEVYIGIGNRIPVYKQPMYYVVNSKCSGDVKYYYGPCGQGTILNTVQQGYSTYQYGGIWDKELCQYIGVEYCPQYAGEDQCLYQWIDGITHKVYFRDGSGVMRDGYLRMQDYKGGFIVSDPPMTQGLWPLAEYAREILKQFDGGGRIYVRVKQALTVYNQDGSIADFSLAPGDWIGMPPDENFFAGSTHKGWLAFRYWKESWYMPYTGSRTSCWFIDAGLTGPTTDYKIDLNPYL